MKTINIFLPDSLAQVVYREVKGGGFASISEYIRNLIRENILKKEENSKFPLPIRVFKKRPLGELRREFETTGKYNKKFIDSVIKGLAQSSIYASKKP